MNLYLFNLPFYSSLNELMFCHFRLQRNLLVEVKILQSEEWGKRLWASRKSIGGLYRK